MKRLNATEYKQFEDIRHIRDDGTEYWLAREIAPVLEYGKWQNFTKVIDKAMIACNNSGHDVLYHFTDVSKMVKKESENKMFFEKWPIIDKCG